MYLTRDAVMQTLADVARFRAGSEIVLTFAQPTDAPSFFEQRSAEVGEQWQSAFMQAEMDELLRRVGFSQVSFLEPADAAGYFLHRADGLPPPTRVSIVSAIR